MPHSLSKDNTAFYDVVEKVGGGAELNLVVGAGSSVDAGLPTWNKLLRDLLEMGFHRAKAADYETLAREAMSASGGATSAATLARVLLGPTRDNDITAALYTGSGYPVTPGRICQAIADLAMLFPGEGRILTLNFDDLLELAIEDAAAGTSIKPAPYGQSPLVSIGDPAEVPIQHLHGYLPNPAHTGASKIGPVILDEADFVGASGARQTLEDLLDDPTRPVLFVGLSLTDSNLISALLECASRRGSGSTRTSWFGLFVSDPGQSPATRDILAARLKSMGVEPVLLTSFGQISQVLVEIELRRSLGPTYWDDGVRYGSRLVDWRKRIEVRYCTPDFDDVQTELSRQLAEFLETELDVGGCMRGPKNDDEYVAELWVRRPNSADFGSVDLWASSAGTLKSKSDWLLDQVRVPVRPKANAPAARALYFGSAQISDTSPLSGWPQASLAYPIYLPANPPLYSIPVGAIVVSCSKPNDASSRNRLQVALQDDVRAAELKSRTEVLGRSMLTP